MRRTRIFIVAASMLLGGGLVAAGRAQTPDAQVVPDQDVQLSLDEVAGGDVAARAQFDADLKLDVPFDVTQAFDDNSLVEKAKAAPILVAEQDRPAEAAGVKVDPKAFLALATLWRVGDTPGVVETVDRKSSIPVCWLNATNANKRGRELTQQAVEATWGHHGAVRFTDWGSCADGALGIKIRVADVRPWSNFGNQAHGESPSMELNFIFNTPDMAGCKTKTDLCIYSIAVHEFGHALGFLHEQDSDDTPQWCRKRFAAFKPGEALKAKMLTNWDRYSVMDYCESIYMKRIQLSDCDIAALRYAYPGTADSDYTPQCKLTGP
jgi:hypothetical protein